MYLINLQSKIRRKYRTQTTNITILLFCPQMFEEDCESRLKYPPQCQAPSPDPQTK